MGIKNTAKQLAKEIKDYERDRQEIKRLGLKPGDTLPPKK